MSPLRSRVQASASALVSTDSDDTKVLSEGQSALYSTQ